MIEPYNLNGNSNIGLMFDGIMEKTFFSYNFDNNLAYRKFNYLAYSEAI